MAAELKRIDSLVVSQEAITVLEETLAEAKQGKVLAIAVAYTDNNGFTHTTYANGSERSGLRDLAAAVAMLQHRILSLWNS